MTIQNLYGSGFEGFLSIRNLVSNMLVIPDKPGVYTVLRPGKKQPTFLSKGSGGHFKNKNPNVSIDKLQTKWVEKSSILYIGKAGGNNNATLRSRLTCYLNFGSGKPVGHWGGRYIWQLSNAEDLLICWKKTPLCLPREIEVELMNDHLTNYLALPFANLKK